MFLSNDILLLGAYDHSVLYATAQLTEGRSARDQPKQPPAKKSPYVPFLERHLVAHLLSGRCGPLPVDVPAHTILDAWLKLLLKL